MLLIFRHPGPLFDAGIAAIVDVAIEESTAQPPRQLIYCRFPLNNGGGNESGVLRQTVQTVVDLLAVSTRVLVTCSAGMSRAPTIAAFSLAAYLDQSPDMVISRIVNTRSLAVNGVFWQDVAELFSQIRRPV